MSVKLLIRIILLSVIALLFLYDIKVGNDRSIHLWDEATYANNSLEMKLNRSYLVYTVDGHVDHHNSKPPLVLWLQVISYYAFGYSEFALRFPSYLALLGTLLLCICYSKKLTESMLPGIVAAMIVLISPGIMRTHVFLSGDLDGVLVFFTAFIFFHHLKMIKQGFVKDKDIYCYALLFTLAYFTKSTAALLILPSILISLLINKQLGSTLIRKATAYSMAVSLALIGGYYFIREHYDPGYLQVVWFSEFTRVTVNIQPWLTYPWNAYFVFIWERFLRYPLMLLAITGPVFLLLPVTKNKKIFLHSLLLALIYLLVITIPPVKLEWYDGPAYPAIAMATGIALTGVMSFMLQRVKNESIREFSSLLIILSLLWSAFIPFSKGLKDSMGGSFEPQEETANALRNLSARHPRTAIFHVIEDIHSPRFSHMLDALRFYQKVIQLNNGTQVSIHNYAAEIKSGDTVIVCQQDKLDSLIARHTTKALDSCRSCKWLKID